MNNSITQIIFENNTNPSLTVALPVYNGKSIAWMSLESLCEQIDVDFNWELIIYEEKHEQSVFPNLIYEYKERLKSVGCSRILFITNNNKVSLVEKWIEIGKNVSENSECFLLQAADCYSPKTRLKISYDKIIKENYDWYDQTKGYFYSFISNRVILYDYKGLTNLNMSLKTEYIKTLPFSPLKKGIDGYIYNWSALSCKNNGKQFQRFFDDELYEDSVDTHGHNNISMAREDYFDTKPAIFTNQNLKYFNLGWNETVKESIEDSSFYSLTIIISTYLNTQYLEECFNSIIDSIGNKKVQVLVGIDSCVESKKYIQSNSYPSNFEFYFFEKNNGPYIVFNSLSTLVKSKNILFFGSDDVMSENMIDDCISGLNTYDCVKPYYTNFFDGKPIDSGTKKQIGEGVFAIKKEIFDYMNGFEPWMCAADSDFMGRLYGLKKYTFKITNKINFYRRIHKNGLTSRPDTGMGSKLRAHYGTLVKKRNSFGPIEKMVIGPFLSLETNKKQIEFVPSKIKKNLSPFELLLNKKPEIHIAKNYVKTEPKPVLKQQIKERAPISNVSNNKTIEEKPQDPNSLANKAKGFSVNNKPQTPKGKDFKIGKDSLRI
jgi:hypothetical protein